MGIPFGIFGRCEGLTVLHFTELFGGIIMPWKCPLCGHQNYATFKNCVCGHVNEEAFLAKNGPTDSRDISEDGTQHSNFSPDCISDHMLPLQKPPGMQVAQSPGKAGQTNGMPHEEVIKEIDSWLFTFSDTDGCISIGTPALHPFRLKMTVEDVEDLLESVYRKTGVRKTIRKIGLAPTDIIEMIERVDRMIEGKRSKVSVNFTNDELQEIASLINTNLQLKVSSGRAASMAP
jgi:hypothetical protein